MSSPEIEDVEELNVEVIRIQSWRMAVLLDAGYALEDADALAGRFDIDLHQAVELVVGRKCAPAIAAKILL